MINKGVYIAIDVETTGLSTRLGGRVIEVGALVLTDGEPGAEFQSLMNPGVAIPKNVQRIHGITEEVLQGQPTPEHVLPKLREFIGAGILIAHNAAFDMAFLRAEFQRQDMDMTNPAVCTLEMSRNLLPGLPNYKLATVYRYLFGELPQDPRHRALVDAGMAGRIWWELTNLHFT